MQKKHKARLGTIDDAVKSQRRLNEPPKEDAIPTDDPVWDGPIPVLADVLDAALKETGRYIVASKTKLATAVLWSAHTHLVHNERVCLFITPRLAIQANVWGSGKSTFLRILSRLSSRGVCRASVTASTVMRTMQETKRTLCLDEADQQLADRDNRHDLMEILDGGHCRDDAMAERMAPTPDGGWKVVYFNVWGAVAFAGIGDLPSQLQDRSIRILMQKATGAEVPEHLRNNTSLALVTIRRQLAAWSDSLFDLPEPTLPDILMRQAGRVGDNWRPLIAIADSAGGQWPALARQAALEAVAAEKKQTQMERLLAAIRRAFDKPAEGLPADAPDNRDRLRTKTLIGWLLDDQEDDWGTAHRGRIITAYWLREQLRGLLEPSGAQDWWVGSGQRVHHRGYLRLQFINAWKRYAPDTASSDSSFPDPAKPSGASGASSASSANLQTSADFMAENAAPDASPEDRIRCSDTAHESQDFSQSAPDALDALDAPDGLEGGGNIKKPAKQGTNRTTTPTTNGSTAAQPAEEADDTDAVDLADFIRAAKSANPTKSIKWLAKHVGQPVDVVGIYLGGMEA